MLKNNSTLAEAGGVLDLVEEDMFKCDESKKRIITRSCREAVQLIKEVYKFKETIEELKADGVTTIDLDTLLNELENFGNLKRKKMYGYAEDKIKQYVGDFDLFVNKGTIRERSVQEFKDNTPLGTEIKFSDLGELSKAKCSMCANGIFTSIKDENTLIIDAYEE